MNLAKYWNIVGSFFDGSFKEKVRLLKRHPERLKTASKKTKEKVVNSMCEDIEAREGNGEVKEWWEIMRNDKECSDIYHKKYHPIHQRHLNDYCKDSNIKSQLATQYFENKLEIIGSAFDIEIYDVWRNDIHKLWVDITSQRMIGTKGGLKRLEDLIMQKIVEFNKINKDVDENKEYVIRENLRRIVGYLRTKQGVDKLFGFNYSQAFNGGDYVKWATNLNKLRNKWNKEGMGEDNQMHAWLLTALKQKRKEFENYIIQNLDKSISEGHKQFLRRGFRDLEGMVYDKLKQENYGKVA